MTETSTDSDDAAYREYAEKRRAAVPPVVYLPVTGRGEGRFAEVELRRTNDGRTALLAYTAMDRLLSCCGPHQPWALMPTDRLGEIEQTQPYDVIYLDLPIPEDEQRTAQTGAGEEGIGRG
ncbi:MAG: SAV_915 family protein [Dermatophilaceae bacterium]